jgi:histone deacetylase 11
MISWFASVAGFIYGIIEYSKYPYIWYISVIYFFLFPFLYETILNIKALLFAHSNRTNHSCSNLENVFPLIYSPHYNITACGLEKCHPFDSRKYGRIFEFLRKKKIVDKNTKIHEPSMPSREFLREVMTWPYLLKLNYSILICKYLEAPLIFCPAFFLRMRALNPMMRATKGSVDAACIAMRKGWAINLSGGYHHAYSSCGGGFCVYPDITFIVYYMRLYHGITRVLIIDLDAH